ncbi:hypothetical protein [Kitasatospora cheerisanensis]|uniref:AAA+ ATPase domain-containing protein n=1 Tax=Kitasatospora cheerisanensis KCTC 2395 TaxID=1348663 RepID=A0A066YG69_9ACTN|nr:hypothetical protein [Kitasatospora cheerisanensis]KDN80493.1 hypothetical protein KCH_77270 [Kitasatospora cheerisanensis KCTC 2395]
MTTHSPEPIVIDLEAEGEFLTDDQPHPGRPADGPTAGTGTGTGTGADGNGTGFATRLAAALASQGRREYTALREGLTVLKTETGTWASASRETPAHLRASLLNRRYATWTAKQAAEVERLEEKATELEKKAKRALAAGQTDEASTADHKQATTLSGAMYQEAADWRERARDIQRQPYTGHIDPTDAELERHRRRTANRRRTALATLTLALGGLELAIGNLVLPTITTAGLLLTAWAKGRITGWRRELPDVPALAYEIATGKPAKDKKETETATATDAPPLPIRQATTEEQAGAAVLQALLGEGLTVGSVTDVTREKWGWKATAHLVKGKPADLVLRLPQLDVALGVRAGGVMAQPQTAAAGSVVLRILLGDPFDPMPPHPVYAPRSNSILRPFSLGPSMDGSPTQVTIAGQNIMVIAVPGGGKSAIVRTLADYITSCTDAIAVDVDPTGRGLGPLRHLAAMTAYDEKRIDDVLDWAIREAEIRTEQMGDDVDNWQVTDDSPAVFVIVDEHPQLTKTQKAKVIKLGRIGRKARVTVVLLSQDATSDVVGDAIADVFGIRIMLPCRKADVPLVVGSDTAISEGWMPHRLVPSPGDWDLADAGAFYIVAPGLRDPILRKATFLNAETATLRTQERLAAGTVTITPEPADVDGDEDLPPVLLAIRAAFDSHGDPDFLLTDQVLEHLATTGPEWRQWEDKDPVDRRREAVKKITREFKKAGLPPLKTDRRVDLNKDNPPSGYWLRDVEAAFEGLPD